jgi:hypothetical protein
LITVVKAMTIWPLLLALAENCWTLAMYSPPAAAKMSKSVRTCVPLIVTLDSRAPAASQ